MNSDLTSIIALVSSRVCHDLASPLQALTTALDVLDSDNSPEMRESALNLIRNSTTQAGAKVDFMRATFGSVTAGKGSMNLEDLKNISNRFFESQKSNLNWETTESEIPRSMGRILMNLLMISLDSLPRGGEITIRSQKNDNILEFSLNSAGLRVNLKEAMRSALMGKEPEEGFDGRTIQPYLAFITASHNNIELAARETEESITLIARLKLENS